MNITYKARRQEYKLERQVYNSILLAIIICFLARISLSPTALLDPDLGWHLMTGKWIFDNGHIPHTDPFSSINLGKPWVAYSWLFEVILWGFHQSLGLYGIITFTVMMAMGIGITLMNLIRHFSNDPATVAGFTVFALLSIAILLRTPRPWLFTILFFLIETNLLLNKGNKAYNARLLLLPLIFMLWANLAIQFIYGLFALFLYAAEPYYARVFSFVKFNHQPINQHPREAWLLFFLSLALTLVNPYGIGLYVEIWKVMQQTGVYNLIDEMLAMNFRTLPHWATLAIGLLAMYLLGRSSKPFHSFTIALFFAGLALGFRSNRDVWFLTIPSLIIVGQAINARQRDRSVAFTWTQGLVAISLSLIVSLVAIILQYDRFSQNGLQATLANEYPVSAAHVVSIKHYPGPLFNHYDWGGFLIWKLPDLPVVIDGRANLHGVEAVEKSFNVWSGRHDWRDNPTLAESRVIIAPRNDALTSLLKMDDRFENIYEDDIANLFIRR